MDAHMNLVKGLMSVNASHIWGGGERGGSKLRPGYPND